MSQIRPGNWRWCRTGGSRRSECRGRRRCGYLSGCGCRSYCWRNGWRGRVGRRRRRRYCCIRRRRLGSRCSRRWGGGERCSRGGGGSWCRRRSRTCSRRTGCRRRLGYTVCEIQRNPEDHEPELIWCLDNPNSYIPIVGVFCIRGITLVYVLHSTFRGLLCRLVVLGWSCRGGRRRRSSVVEGLHLGPLDNMGAGTTATCFRRSCFSSLTLGH